MSDVTAIILSQALFGTILLLHAWLTTRSARSFTDLSDRLLDAVIAKNGVDAAAIERLRKARMKPRRKRDQADRPGEWFGS